MGSGSGRAHLARSMQRKVHSALGTLSHDDTVARGGHGPQECLVTVEAHIRRGRGCHGATRATVARSRGPPRRQAYLQSILARELERTGSRREARATETRAIHRSPLRTLRTKRWRKPHTHAHTRHSQCSPRQKERKKSAGSSNEARDIGTVYLGSPPISLDYDYNNLGTVNQ
jgi:hypothetical protein